MNNLRILLNGIVKDNPIFVLLLGMCPTLGTSSSAANAMGMGLATAFTLLCTNTVIAALKAAIPIPDKVRIPCYVAITAMFVTLVQMLIQAFFPALYQSLGLFIPLIVVNCLILGRAEAFAAKNNPLRAALDGLGCGIGFTLALTLLGAIRELLGTGKVFAQTLFPESCGALIFVLAPGAFIVLGFLIALFNRLRNA